MLALAWRVHKEHGRGWAGTAAQRLVASGSASRLCSSTIGAIPCPMSHLFALVAPRSGHELGDAYTVPAVASITTWGHEPASVAGFLQSSPMVQVGAQGAVDAESARRVSALSARLSFSLALVVLSFSFALALDKAVLRLVEDPGEVIPKVLHRVDLLQLGRWCLLHDHIDLARALVELKEVVEGLGKVRTGLLPEDHLAIAVAVVSVATLAVVLILPKGPSSLLWLVDSLAKELANRLLHLRKVDGAIGQNLYPLLLVLSKIPLSKKKMPEEMAASRGAQKVKPLALELPKRSFLRCHKTAQALIGTTSPFKDGLVEGLLQLRVLQVVVGLLDRGHDALVAGGVRYLLH